jgi:hypothetical protein
MNSMKIDRNLEIYRNELRYILVVECFEKVQERYFRPPTPSKNLRQVRRPQRGYRRVYIYIYIYIYTCSGE